MIMATGRLGEAAELETAPKVILLLLWGRPVQGKIDLGTRAEVLLQKYLQQALNMALHQ